MLISALVALCCSSLTVDVPLGPEGTPTSEGTAVRATQPDSADLRALLPDGPLPKVDVSKTTDDAAVRNSESSSASVQPLISSPVKPDTPEPYDTPRKRKIWYGLIAAGHGASVFDAWTTRRAISGGYGVEGDPIQRPFANSGAVYFSTQVTPLLMDYLGHRMMKSDHAWMRKVWWVPQAAGASVSLGAGIHNYRLVP